MTKVNDKNIFLNFVLTYLFLLVRIKPNPFTNIFTRFRILRPRSGYESAMDLNIWIIKELLILMKYKHKANLYIQKPTSVNKRASSTLMFTTFARRV